MSNYPYPELLPFLKIKLSVEDYQEVLQIAQSETLYYPEESPLYQATLSEYTLSRCPFCGVECCRKFDVYSLHYWQNRALLRDWNLEQPYGRGLKLPRFPTCEHLLGMQYFINLHGATSLDTRPSFVIPWGEVPYISRCIMNSRITIPRAVLHALPICRIADDHFIPAYTYFFLTYFLEDKQKYLENYLELQDQRAEGDDEYEAGALIDPLELGVFNLLSVSQKGLLGWLALDQPDENRLCIGSGLELPTIYQNIQGKRKSLVWDFKNQILR